MNGLPEEYVRSLTIPLLLVVTLAAAGDGSRPQPAPLVESYLVGGRLADGESALSAKLHEQPGDDQLRFSLGVVRFLRAIERLGQSLHRYGLQSDIGQKLGIPILRLPVPANAAPEPITYEDSRRILQGWIDDLRRAEATLAGIRDEGVKLSIPFGLVRLDLDGDGEASDAERLLIVYSQLNRGVAGMLRQSPEFKVSLDAADAHWLRGYCHLLMGMSDFVLAYDQKDQFERTARLFYPKAETPYSFLDTRGDEAEIVDLVVAIHMLRWPLREPSRLQDSLGHLRAMVAESRESWRRILDEWDDDREWIPSPRQTGVVPNVKITQDMVDQWQLFLDEVDGLLAGRKLLGHWRVSDGRGINLSRVLAEPTDFDLVLWIQGSAAAPYLEQGDVSGREVWDRLQRVFRGEFIGFAVWFN